MTTVLAEPKPKLMSIDEFMALPDSVGYELVEGVLTERKAMGALADYVAMQCGIELGLFCRETARGYVFGAETTYRCFGDNATGRRADVSFIARGRLPGEQIPVSYVTIPADLVVEVISPNDLAVEVEEKVRLYLRHGFGEVWVVYPETRTVYVHRQGEPVLLIEAGQELRGRGPLEGFACPVDRFFPASPASPAGANAV
jgi:Uma2 family endonuclease